MRFKERTMELKVGSPFLSRQLLLPFVIFLNGVVPVFLTLHILSPLLSINLGSECFCESFLSFQTCCFSGVGLGLE